MKFDPTRAGLHIQALENLPYQTENDHERLTEWLVAELERSGWQAKRHVVTGSSSAAAVRRALAGFILTLGMTCVMLLAEQDAGVVWCLACWIAAVLLGTFAPTGLAWVRAWPVLPMRRAAVVIARRARAQEPAKRVLIQTSLGPTKRRAGRSRDGTIKSALMVFAVFVLLACFGCHAAIPQTSRRLVAGVGWLSIAALWATLLLGLIQNLIPDRGAMWSCDRPGLALLLELACAWPQGRFRNVELVLAAVGGQDLDLAGDQFMAEMFGKDALTRPTLHVVVDAPGVGKDLLILDHGGMCAHAAESLWVPHRLPSRREVEERIRFLPHGQTGNEVWLGGSENRQDAAMASPEVLCRTAALIAELALRWGKSDGQRPVQPDERTASRSFQNPG